MIYLFKPHVLHASSYLLKSCATYLFPVMKNWGAPIPVYGSEGEDAPLLTSCPLCGAPPSNANLCKNMRLHQENNICLRSGGS